MSDTTIYAPGIGYKCVKRKDGFAKLERMNEADYKRHGVVGGEEQTRKTEAALAAAKAAVERHRAQQRARLAGFAGWTKRNPALDAVEKTAQAEGDLRDPETVLREWIGANDRAEQVKARELAAAKAKLMRQAGGKAS